MTSSASLRRSAQAPTSYFSTTGLGTPTGNPIAPVVKLSTNSDLAKRMSDSIDIDTGPIVSGERTIEKMGRRNS